MTSANTLQGYTIVFKKSAQKDFERLPAAVATIIGKKLRQLTEEIHSLDILKLVGYCVPTYRMRVGDYRIIYEIYEREIVVLVIGIKHRKDAY